MHIVLIIILFKIALTVLMVTLGAMFMAEFFPVLAAKAIASSNGTPFEPVGEGLAYTLNFVAKYAQIFVEWVFNWLRAFGIDANPNFMESGIKEADFEAPKNVEKPKF